MAVTKSRAGFADTETGQKIRQKLLRMTEDAAYNTSPVYSANGLLYSDNLMPFVDKHMNYLISHPMLDPDMYIANVKLLTRIR